MSGGFFSEDCINISSLTFEDGLGIKLYCFSPLLFILNQILLMTDPVSASEGLTCVNPSKSYTDCQVSSHRSRHCTLKKETKSSKIHTLHKLTAVLD